MLSVFLRFANSNHPFDIFKLFLHSPGPANVVMTSTRLKHYYSTSFARFYLGKTIHSTTGEEKWVVVLFDKRTVKMAPWLVRVSPVESRQIL